MPKLQATLLLPLLRKKKKRKNPLLQLAVCSVVQTQTLTIQTMMMTPHKFVSQSWRGDVFECFCFNRSSFDSIFRSFEFQPGLRHSVENVEESSMIFFSLISRIT